MKYVSTRGDRDERSFCDILLEGLAPDGGLYLPVAYPRVDGATLARWRTLTYAELAFEILSLYIYDIPPADLRALAARTYTAEVFGTAAIVPLRKLEDGLFLEGLSNGPTLAFKDIAMQLLGQLFEYELGRRGRTLNILGATSGDTGSAAEYALRGKKGVSVFMLSPHGRMSPFQQAQMFSLADANIHNLCVEGVFDDCQDIVKAVSNDLAFKRRWHIGTVNSINWARLLAQVVYYFAGYFQATASNDERVSFAVPSGNFGNVCAGHVARMMGLPIGRLVVATNENDVLDEFFRTGRYRVRGSAETHETSSPSMDISKASNFERFVFDLLGRDGARVRALFGETLARDGVFALSADEQARIADFGFVSGRSTHADRLATIRDTDARFDVLVDTHTADGLQVARERRLAGETMIVLETALPVKFADTIEEALGRRPPLPAALADLESRPRRFTVVPADAAVVKAFIETHAPAAPARGALISADDALGRLLAAVGPSGRTETLPTPAAWGRVLAADVVSSVDVPPADNSAMDGYAVRVADLAGGAPLPVSQRIPAGVVGRPLAAGSAARIFTGAQVPPGADAVVMQEHCEAIASASADEPFGAVRVRETPAPGAAIRRRGEDVRSGSVVLAAGHRLDSAAIGLAATVGRATLEVAAAPRVGLFSTGDELVMPGEPLPPGAIYNSNRFMLGALLRGLGCVVNDLGNVPDRLDETRRVLREAAQGNDLILSSGGVSVGEEDHLKPALAAEGRLDLWAIAIKPGKPLAFGAVRRAHDAAAALGRSGARPQPLGGRPRYLADGADNSETWYIGLPGNPVSSYVTFALFVRPVLLRLQGATALLPVGLPARADFAWPRPDKRREFLRVRRNATGGLDLFANQGSGVLTSLAWGDGLADIAPGQVVNPGDTVRFLSLAELAP